jgi:hypothetical protein
MITAEDLRSRAKIKAVKDQIDRPCAAGEMATIVCPYCDALNVEGSNLCCELLRQCVVVLMMERRRERLEERLSGN